ncbi:ASCH domain-containing protein [Paenibacillus ihuae]|uniref:ASCH domain-containing protein n=1 Tax=Paenibacillus ihuae TaxID=1232431 RepID=UPI0006D53435|nr:ASCH domain-containing protein [Paenibacillus ihuae]
MKVLLSIKPEFVKKIFSGEKKYEYRKSIFKREVESILVYSTKPVGKIVGEIFIEEILIDEPESIWKATSEHSGISYNFFREYFENRNKGYAIKIKKAILFDIPIDPFQDDKNFKAPQSYCYIKERRE